MYGHGAASTLHSAPSPAAADDDQWFQVDTNVFKSWQTYFYEEHNESSGGEWELSTDALAAEAARLEKEMATGEPAAQHSQAAAEVQVDAGGRLTPVTVLRNNLSTSTMSSHSDSREGSHDMGNRSSLASSGGLGPGSPGSSRSGRSGSGGMAYWDSQLATMSGVFGGQDDAEATFWGTGLPERGVDAREHSCDLDEAARHMAMLALTPEQQQAAARARAVRLRRRSGGTDSPNLGAAKQQVRGGSHDGGGRPIEQQMQEQELRHSGGSSRRSIGDGGSRRSSGDGGSRRSSGDGGSRRSSGDGGSRRSSGDGGSRRSSGDGGSRRSGNAGFRPLPTSHMIPEEGSPLLESSRSMRRTASMGLLSSDEKKGGSALRHNSSWDHGMNLCTPFQASASGLEPFNTPGTWNTEDSNQSAQSHESIGDMWDTPKDAGGWDQLMAQTTSTGGPSDSWPF